MPQQISVYGQVMGQAYDLAPGESHYWVLWGPAADNGVVAWISVKPFPPDPQGEKVLAVKDFSYEATDDGGRRLFYTVTNTGPGYVLAYAIYCAWTDVITSP